MAQGVSSHYPVGDKTALPGRQLGLALCQTLQLGWILVRYRPSLPHGRPEGQQQTLPWVLLHLIWLLYGAEGR